MPVPATHHPRRCYCPRFAPGHLPGLKTVTTYGQSCEGDAHLPHDAATCPACLSGADDLQTGTPAGQVPDFLKRRIAWALYRNLNPSATAEDWDAASSEVRLMHEDAALAALNLIGALRNPTDPRTAL